MQATSDPTPRLQDLDAIADSYCRGEAVRSIVFKTLNAAQTYGACPLRQIIQRRWYHLPPLGARRHETQYHDVFSQASIRPFDVDYSEMHETGTRDAVEMSSISNVFAPVSSGRPAALPQFVVPQKRT